MFLKSLILGCVMVAGVSQAEIPAFIYHCPNNHTVDVYGDAGLSLRASVDSKAALELAGTFTLPASDENHSDVDMFVFGKKGQPLRIIIAQAIGGSDSVTISYVEGNRELWAYKCVGDTK